MSLTHLLRVVAAGILVSANLVAPASAAEKVNVCELKDGSYTATQVNSNKPLGTGDYAYSGPVDASGVPDSTGDQWCEDNAPVSGDVSVKKVTICHATNAASNPYTQNTVSISAVDGEGKSDHDHHTGPVFDPGVRSQDNRGWGDIIPPVEGVTDGMNWTVYGQAVYGNECSIPEFEPFNVCHIDGDNYEFIEFETLEDVVNHLIGHQGEDRDDLSRDECPVPGQGGGDPEGEDPEGEDPEGETPNEETPTEETPETPGGQGGGDVLGANTTTPNVTELPRTGMDSYAYLLALIVALGAGMIHHARLVAKENAR